MGVLAGPVSGLVTKRGFSTKGGLPMSIYSSGPIAAPNTPHAGDTLQALADLIPSQLNQTRNQLASLLAKTATPAATVLAMGVAEGVPVVAQTVAEIASAAIEDKIYEATNPLPVDPSVRSALVRNARQEVFNSAQGLDAPKSSCSVEPPRMKRLETPFGERLVPEKKRDNQGLLGDVFGSIEEIHRERDRRLQEVNQSLIAPRIRSLL